MRLLDDVGVHTSESPQYNPNGCMYNCFVDSPSLYGVDKLYEVVSAPRPISSLPLKSLPLLKQHTSYNPPNYPNSGSCSNTV